MRILSDKAFPSQPMILRFLVRRFEWRHPQAWAGLLLAAGLWHFFLGAILCAYGYWWGAALIAVAALELWVAQWLLTNAPGLRAAAHST
jgi:hypothetical protein